MVRSASPACTDWKKWCAISARRGPSISPEARSSTSPAARWKLTRRGASARRRASRAPARGRSGSGHAASLHLGHDAARRSPRPAPRGSAISGLPPTRASSGRSNSRPSTAAIASTSLQLADSRSSRRPITSLTPCGISRLHELVAADRVELAFGGEQPHHLVRRRTGCPRSRGGRPRHSPRGGARPPSRSMKRSTRPRSSPRSKTRWWRARARAPPASRRAGGARPQLDVAVGADQRAGAPAPSSRARNCEQQQRRLVGPVQVVEHEHQRRAAERRCAGTSAIASNSRKRACSRLEARRRRQPGQHVAELGDDGRDVGRAGAELGAELARLAVAHAGAHDLHPRPVRRRAARPRGSGPSSTCAPRIARVGGELLGECASCRCRAPPTTSTSAAVPDSASSKAARSCCDLRRAADEDAAGQPVERIRGAARPAPAGSRAAATPSSACSATADGGRARPDAPRDPSRAARGPERSSAAGIAGLCHARRHRRRVDVLRDHGHRVVAA